MNEYSFYKKNLPLCVIENIKSHFKKYTNEFYSDNFFFLSRKLSSFALFKNPDTALLAGM